MPAPCARLLLVAALNSTQDFAKTQIGTPYYLSPEICQNLPYNRKSDVWAMGCILYELLCLRVPFEGQDLPRLINKILRTSYPRPPAKYSKETHQLVDSMLQKDPKVCARVCWVCWALEPRLALPVGAPIDTQQGRGNCRARCI